MNKEDYVSLEVAKLLKEKGFGVPCLSQYTERGTIWNCQEPENFNATEGCYSRPTLYESAKWLRNKYDINVAVNAVIPMWFDRRPKNNDTLYMPSITHKNVDGKIEMLMLRNLNDFNYEEVYNNGILEALKLI